MCSKILITLSTISINHMFKNCFKFKKGDFIHKILFYSWAVPNTGNPSKSSFQYVTSQSYRIGGKKSPILTLRRPTNRHLQTSANRIRVSLLLNPIHLALRLHLPIPPPPPSALHDLLRDRNGYLQPAPAANPAQRPDLPVQLPQPRTAVLTLSRPNSPSSPWPSRSSSANTAGCSTPTVLIIPIIVIIATIVTLIVMAIVMIVMVVAMGKRKIGMMGKGKIAKRKVRMEMGMWWKRWRKGFIWGCGGTESCILERDQVF